MYGESRKNHGLNWIAKVKLYSGVILPMEFDNSLSLLEKIAHLIHKCNEIADAINAQNLNITEFCHMVELEISKFEEYIDDRIDTYENDLKKEWEEYKNEINQAWLEYKDQLENEWSEEQEKNEQFRNEINQVINDFTNDLTEQFEVLKHYVEVEFTKQNGHIESSLNNIKNTMQIQQNEFENHMVELFTDYTTDESTARTEFEQNFQRLFEQWKIDTINAIKSDIGAFETTTQENLNRYIDAQMSVYKSSIENRLSEQNRKIQQEMEDRIRNDNNLQNQINQLTPEGSIKSDSPDDNGESQLYIIDQNTNERENIFPKIREQENNYFKLEIVEPRFNHDWFNEVSNFETTCNTAITISNKIAIPVGTSDINLLSIPVDKYFQYIPQYPYPQSPQFMRNRLLIDIIIHHSTTNNFPDISLTEIGWNYEGGEGGPYLDIKYRLNLKSSDSSTTYGVGRLKLTIKVMALVK